MLCNYIFCLEYIQFNKFCFRGAMSFFLNGRYTIVCISYIYTILQHPNNLRRLTRHKKKRTPCGKEKQEIGKQQKAVTPDMFWTVCEGPMKNVRCVSPFQPNVCHPVVPPPCTLVLPALLCTSLHLSALLILLFFFSFPLQKSPVNATSNQTSSRMLTCIAQKYKIHQI